MAGKVVIRAMFAEETTPFAQCVSKSAQDAVLQGHKKLLKLEHTWRAICYMLYKAHSIHHKHYTWCDIQNQQKDKDYQLPLTRP